MGIVGIILVVINVGIIVPVVLSSGGNSTNKGVTTCLANESCSLKDLSPNPSSPPFQQEPGRTFVYSNLLLESLYSLSFLFFRWCRP